MFFLFKNTQESMAKHEGLKFRKSGSSALHISATKVQLRMLCQLSTHAAEKKQTSVMLGLALPVLRPEELSKLDEDSW